MVKLPYEYVIKHVDELYKKKFDENDLKGIDAHCQFIAEFIRASGWTEDELFRVMIGLGSLYYLN